MAAFRRVYDAYRVVEDIYPGLAQRFQQSRVRRFAELGGGRGPISAILAGEDVATLVVDLDDRMLADSHRPALKADIRRVPVPDGAFDGAAAVNCLYFLDDPRTALYEARRILRRGGLFVASTPARHNDPELEGIDPAWGTPSSFDAEEAPDLVAEVFGLVDVEPWRLTAYVLPDRPAITDYFHAFNIPDWEARAARIEPPLSITKVGAQVWARA
jgi:SAM-dependent methyltransferase